jgi:hypothetical protein
MFPSRLTEAVPRVSPASTARWGYRTWAGSRDRARLRTGRAVSLVAAVDSPAERAVRRARGDRLHPAREVRIRERAVGADEATGAPAVTGDRLALQQLLQEGS